MDVRVFFESAVRRCCLAGEELLGERRPVIWQRVLVADDDQLAVEALASQRACGGQPGEPAAYYDDPSHPSAYDAERLDRAVLDGALHLRAQLVTRVGPQHRDDIVVVVDDL